VLSVVWTTEQGHNPKHLRGGCQGFTSTTQDLRSAPTNPLPATKNRTGGGPYCRLPTRIISIQLNAGVIFVLHLVVWCSCQEGRGRRGRLPPTKFSHPTLKVQLRFQEYRHVPFQLNMDNFIIGLKSIRSVIYSLYDRRSPRPGHAACFVRMKTG